MSSSARPPWRNALLFGAAVAAVLSLVVPSIAPDQSEVTPWLRALATVLLMLFAATTFEPVSRLYRAFVSLGLIGCLAADLLLAQPSEPYVASLLLSLAALLALFAAFVRQSPLLRYKAGVVGYAAVATVVLALVLPVVGGTVRSTLVAHVIALALTASQAASWMLEDLASRAARLAAFGMSCLVAANAVLTLDRFVFIVPARDLLVLAPYFIALAALALSVERPPPPALRL